MLGPAVAGRPWREAGRAGRFAARDAWTAATGPAQPARLCFCDRSVERKSMITRIREVRQARNLTLQEVAARCEPPTTPQTIGRLEMGTRTVSVAWLNRIAGALDVLASDLVRLPDRNDVPIAALLDQDGAHPPSQARLAVPPQPGAGLVAVTILTTIGDYRAGDEVWLERIGPERFAFALNRDVLAPRPGGRFLFGRLIGREEGRLHLFPPGAGQRQAVLSEPDWIAVATKLIRDL